MSKRRTDNAVDRVVPSLIETGSYTHPYLGVETRTVVPAIAAANGGPSR